jgi:hypothetical protein
MKTQTNNKIILSISQMENIIKEMKENKSKNRYLSDTVRFDLDFNTDHNAHNLNLNTGYQFNSYAECNGTKVKIIEK